MMKLKTLLMLIFSSIGYFPRGRELDTRTKENRLSKDVSRK